MTVWPTRGQGRANSGHRRWSFRSGISSLADLPEHTLHFGNRRILRKAVGQGTGNEGRIQDIGADPRFFIEIIADLTGERPAVVIGEAQFLRILPVVSVEDAGDDKNAEILRPALVARQFAVAAEIGRCRPDRQFSSAETFPEVSLSVKDSVPASL